MTSIITTHYHSNVFCLVLMLKHENFKTLFSYYTVWFVTYVFANFINVVNVPRSVRKGYFRLFLSPGFERNVATAVWVILWYLANGRTSHCFYWSCIPLPSPSQNKEINQLHPSLSVSSLKLFEIIISLTNLYAVYEQSVCVGQTCWRLLYIYIFFFRNNNLVYLEEGAIRQTVFRTLKFIFIMFPK